MRITTSIALLILRITAVVQLVLGLLFWTGHAVTYVPVHILNGILFVLSLWTLAVIALATRTGRGLAVFGLLWGLALPAFGIRQAGFLVGPEHWIIRVVHLLMALIAIAAGGALGTAVLAALPKRVPPADLERENIAARRAS